MFHVIAKKKKYQILMRLISLNLVEPEKRTTIEMHKLKNAKPNEYTQMKLIVNL